MRSGLNSNFSSYLPDSVRKDLSKLGMRVEYPRDTVVFKRGDIGDAFYVLYKGAVTLSMKSGEQKEIILHRLFDGDAFGETSLFARGEGVRTATATAHKNTALLRIERSEFIEFINKSADAQKAMIRFLADKLYWNSELLEGFLFDTILHRLINRLVALSERHANKVDSLLELKQSDLAKMIGASREEINKNLQLLQDRGLVFLRRGQILIPEVDKLRKVMEVVKDDNSLFVVAEKSVRKVKRRD